MLYFAYGSNLNPAQMRVRCPGAKRCGPLILPNGRLVFRNVADVVIDHNSVIAGGVWRITAQHERDLDRFEGVGSKWYRKRYIKLSLNEGESEDCLYYQMITKTGVMPPSQAYYNTMLEGYRWFGLDETLLNQALHDSWDDKNITVVLRDRHIRKGRPALKRIDPHVRPVLATSQFKSTTGKRKTR